MSKTPHAAGRGHYARRVSQVTSKGRVRPNPIPWVLIPAALVALTSGAALVITILFRTSLKLTLIAVLVITAGLATVSLRRAAPPVRRELVRRLRAGALAGVLATIAYDITRFGLVSLTSLTIKPFHALAVFGQMLVGEHAPGWAIATAGIGYHVTNGVTFSIAYTLVVRRPSVLTGLIWAAVLECFMITLYPGWLNIEKVDELALVSILGHVAFGATLGLAARVLLDDGRRRRRAAARVQVPPAPPRGGVA